MVFRRIVYNQAQLNRIPLEKRVKYYFDDDFVASVPGFSDNNEPMVELDVSKHPFLLEPFWEDEPVKIRDKDTQRIINLESEFFKTYLQKNPDFRLKIRSGVLDQLLKVRSFLPKELKITIKMGYRPIEIQKKLFKEIFESIRRKHPNQNRDRVYKTTLQFIDDPDKYIARHATGGAIDLTLFNERTSTYLDFGCPVNYPDSLSWTYNSKPLTRRQIENRLLLTEAMFKANFCNLASEWWHYSYGDQQWALFFNKKRAKYGIYEE